MRRPAAARLALPALAGVWLAACGGEAPAPTDEPADEADVVAPIEAAPSPATTPSPAPAASVPADGPPVLVPEADKGETGARNVLLEWARDLERGDFDGAYSLWLDGSRSGMTRAEHAAFWGRYRDLTVAVPGGTMEGAAGSLYYEAPATVTGRTRDGMPATLTGTVVLRRVNDVPGASAAQLRWHIERVDLQPN